MPRLGPALAVLALCVAACEQHNAPASGSSAAAPSNASPAPASTAPAAAIPPGFAGAPYAASRTYFKLQGRYPSAWLLCDGVDQPRMTVIGLPDAGRGLATFSLDKRTGAHSSQALKVGEPDPGAGNVYWPLSHADGREAGYLRFFNPGMIDDPRSATTPTLTSIKLDAEIASCRWVPHTRVLAAGARRSYQITAEGGQLVYRTFDYARAATAQSGGAGTTSAPSLEIRGGQEATIATGRLFSFDNQGYRYMVEVGGPASAHGAVTVVKAGRQVAAEPFEAYVYAPPG